MNMICNELGSSDCKDCIEVPQGIIAVKNIYSS